MRSDPLLHRSRHRLPRIGTIQHRTVDMAGAITVQNNVHLERLLMTDPTMEKRVQEIVRKVLAVARSQVSQSIKGEITNDPRQAYRAVKHAVYKRILGGNVSILNKRLAGKNRAPLPPVYHKLEHELNKNGKPHPNHRGGNRIQRSSRTEDLLTYKGSDRGFILRFLNAGTSSRNNGVRPTGAIAPRNFFANNSQKAMEMASEQLMQYIDKMIQEEFNQAQ